jgi:hypothetical protein
MVVPSVRIYESKVSYSRMPRSEPIRYLGRYNFIRHFIDSYQFCSVRVETLSDVNLSKLVDLVTKFVFFAFKSIISVSTTLSRSSPLIKTQPIHDGDTISAIVF